MDSTPTLNNIPLKKEGFATIADALDYAAAGITGLNFYSRKGDLYYTLPYSILRREARALARRMLGLGISRGDRIAIVAVTHPDFVRFFFACQYAGFVPVPLPANTHINGAEAYIRQLRRLVMICGARVAVSTDEFIVHLETALSDYDMLMVARPEEFDALPESDFGLQPLGPGELAYLQFTSGSTRFPKGVMMTQASVMKNLSEITGPGIEIRPGDRAVSWLPFYHDMGLVGLLLASMASQLSVDFFSTNDFVMRPRLWLKIISEKKGTVSFGPPFAYELAAMRLKPADVKEFDLTSWRIAGIGAEMIRKDVLDRFAECLKPSGFDPKAFIPCYGMAECALAVTFSDIEKEIEVDIIDADRLAEDNEVVHTDAGSASRINTFVRCGKPLPSFEVEIRDEDGNILEEGRCGTLFLKGPSIMTGYFEDEESTRAVLGDDGWFNTGDIAYWSDGQIVITGRSKDLIIINGRNIWPQDIEYLAETVNGVRTGDACAFSCEDSAGRERAVLLVQSRSVSGDEHYSITDVLKRLVMQEFGIDCDVVIVPRNTIVRTTSGKPSRSGTRKIYLQMMAAQKNAA